MKRVTLSNPKIFLLLLQWKRFFLYENILQIIKTPLRLLSRSLVTELSTFIWIIAKLRSNFKSTQSLQYHDDYYASNNTQLELLEINATFNLWFGSKWDFLSVSLCFLNPQRCFEKSEREKESENRKARKNTERRKLIRFNYRSAYY